MADGDDGTRSWLFDRTDQVRWYEVTLDKGQDYAFWASSWGDEGWTGFRSPTVTVYGLAGEQLMVLSPPVNYSPVGRGFRAPATSTYYLRAVATLRPPDLDRVGLQLGVAFDCAKGPATRCTLSVGQRTTGHHNFYLDQDWRRVTTKAGQSYTVLLGSRDGPAGAQVRDRQGRIVGSCESSTAALERCVGFTAAYEGSYYVTAYLSGWQEGSYQLGLTSP